MKKDKEIAALVLEKDERAAASITDVLRERSYPVKVVPSRAQALKLMEDTGFQLAIVGEDEDGASVFEVMKDMVKKAPLTSLILVTDLPEKEVEDRAEGYGILGGISREGSREDLVRLLDRLEEILGLL